MTKVSLDGESIFVIREFMPPAECDAFIEPAESAGFEEATITTSAGFIMAKDIRDNARVISDDPDLAAQLWRRAEPFVPDIIDTWRATGLNESFRYYRYEPGQNFSPHFDGAFERPNGERSELTFMVYLNDDFAGGATRFFHLDRTLRLSVQPERGSALVFVHRQLHEGSAVDSGRKYVLRTDVMYAEEP